MISAKSCSLAFSLGNSWSCFSFCSSLFIPPVVSSMCEQTEASKLQEQITRNNTRNYTNGGSVLYRVGMNWWFRNSLFHLPKFPQCPSKICVFSMKNSFKAIFVFKWDCLWNHALPWWSMSYRGRPSMKSRVPWGNSCFCMSLLMEHFVSQDMLIFCVKLFTIAFVSCENYWCVNEIVYESLGFLNDIMVFQRYSLWNHWFP